MPWTGQTHKAIHFKKEEEIKMTTNLKIFKRSKEITRKSIKLDSQKTIIIYPVK